MAIISYGLWQQMFGGDSRALGSTIHLNGAPVIVIGVARAGFDYPSRTAVWTPTTFDFERLPENGSNILADDRATQSRASHSNKRKACLKASCDRSRRSVSPALK